MVSDTLNAPTSIKQITGLCRLQIQEVPPCVYFLVKGDEVVYIGQSVDVCGRITAHRASDKEFDRVFYVPFRSELLCMLEGALIRALKPKLNGNKGPLSHACEHELKDIDEKFLVRIGFAQKET
jgi:hypothetical protein